MIEAVVFPCTYRCDAKCIMCSIYERKQKDISVEKFEVLFKDKVMRNLKSINITGGEPTLRSDLHELIGMIIKNCKNLKEVIINTNGLNSEQIVQQIQKILSCCGENINVFVYVSLDATNQNASAVRGVKFAAERSMRTILTLKKLEQNYQNFHVGIACTLTSKNLTDIQKVYYFAQEQDVYIDFIMATVNSTYINSEAKKEQFVIKEDLAETINFLFSTLNYQKTVSSAHYFNSLRQQPTTELKSCILRKGVGILIEADGKIRPCGMTHEVLLGDVLKPETFQHLGEDVTCKMKKYCRKCQTDSFYQWNTHGQAELKEAMFKKLLKERRGQ